MLPGEGVFQQQQALFHRFGALRQEWVAACQQE
jgi:hypothetical protein